MFFIKLKIFYQKEWQKCAVHCPTSVNSRPDSQAQAQPWLCQKGRSDKNDNHRPQSDRKGGVTLPNTSDTHSAVVFLPLKLLPSSVLKCERQACGPVEDPEC